MSDWFNFAAPALESATYASRVSGNSTIFTNCHAHDSQVPNGDAGVLRALLQE